MSKRTHNLSFLNVILSILCIVMLVFQFLPFWNNGENTCSMQRMLWFPNDQGSIPQYISDSIGEKFNIDSVVWLTLLTFVTSVLGAVFCAVKRQAFFPTLFPLVGSFSAVWNYLSRPALQLGQLWGVHLAIGIMLFLVSVYTLYVYWKTKKEA